MSIVVRRAAVDEIRPIRMAVLRPGRPAADSVYPEDDVAVHLAAWDGGLPVGCATVFPAPWPGDPDPAAPPAEPTAWRLRGMAVDTARQAAGVGRALLVEAVAAARGGGAPLLWANGRSPALGFYERLGWQVIGAEFLDASSGVEHRRIVLPLSGPAVRPAT